MTNPPKRLFIIDAMALAFRSFHAFSQTPLKTKLGQPSSAVFGSAVFLLKLLKDEKPDYLIVATDTKEKNFRHELYPDYKANRSEMPEDLACQIPYIYRLFTELGCPAFSQSGYEADDLIGSMTKQFASTDLQVYIVSGDKDFMQLMNENTFLYSPKKNSPPTIINIGGVKERFGCTPLQVVDVLGIMGDSADHVPGVRGIGEKGAIKLIEQFGSVENIYANIDRVTNVRLKTLLLEQREQALLSKRLVTIITDIPLKISLETHRCKDPGKILTPELEQLFVELDFKSLISQLKQGATTAEKLAPNNAKQQIDTDHNVSRAAPAKHLADDAAQKEVEEPQKAAKQFLQLSDLLRQDNYHFVDNLEKYNMLLRCLREAPAFAIDTETTGLHCIEDKAIGISFAFFKDYQQNLINYSEDSLACKTEAYYLPLNLDTLSVPSEDFNELKTLLNTLTTKKLGHNLKFDLQMLRNVGINLQGPFSDSMLLNYLINPIANSHKLDDLCAQFFNYQKIPTTRFADENGKITMKKADPKELAVYACEDADFTLLLNRKLSQIALQSNLLEIAEKIEFPMLQVLADMEQCGVYIDAAELAELSTYLQIKIAALEKQIHVLAGATFNINSPKQLAEILFEKLKIHQLLNIKNIKKTKTGFSTDVGVLEILSEHPLPQAILEYRSLFKLKNTYVDSLPQLISPVTGRLHTSFHQTGTATGRLSSSHPNLQNIPIRSEEGQKIRRAFKPQQSNEILISADYSQVELRILAHLSKDPNLISAFQNNEDIHTNTAVKIFGEQAKQDKRLRSQAKAINFGIIYGMGPQRLSKQTGVSLPEAKTSIQKYFASYPAIQHYIQSAKAFASENGYSVTLLGRKRPIPEIHSKNPAVRASGENIAINSPIQGSAADIIKLAMIKIFNQFDQQNLKAKIILQVHDELVVSCPAEEKAAASAIVKQTMESAFPLDVPLLVEVGCGLNWLEAH
ncbi:MAG: DNA polymerase I [Oligoflexales bacterium]|nr:DNA polymerase I [Oligoflexales bacterium]